MGSKKRIVLEGSIGCSFPNARDMVRVGYVKGSIGIVVKTCVCVLEVVLKPVALRGSKPFVKFEWSRQLLIACDPAHNVCHRPS